VTGRAWGGFSAHFDEFGLHMRDGQLLHVLVHDLQPTAAGQLEYHCAGRTAAYWAELPDAQHSSASVNGSKEGRQLSRPPCRAGCRGRSGTSRYPALLFAGGREVPLVPPHLAGQAVAVEVAHHPLLGLHLREEVLLRRRLPVLAVPRRQPLLLARRRALDVLRACARHLIRCMPESRACLIVGLCMANCTT
jgi:hypothetical protein